MTKKPASTRKIKHPKRQYTLYVILHGEVAICEEQDCVRLYAPSIPDHAYMAGPWLGERHIPFGSTFTLRGVGPQTACDSIHTDANLANIVVLKNGSANPAGAHFEIRLPRAEKILPGFLVPRSSYIPAEEVELPSVPPPALQFDLRPIFQYTTDTPNVYLEMLAGPTFHEFDQTIKHPWNVGRGKKPTKPGHRESLSLHIFAEDDIPVDSEHEQKAFHMAAGILGKGITVAPPPTPGVSAIAVVPIVKAPHGLHPSEVAITLRQRATVVGKIGTQLRQGERLNWVQGLVVVGSSLGSCGPVGT